jgi:hypothetical protein
MALTFFMCVGLNRCSLAHSNYYKLQLASAAIVFSQDRKERGWATDLPIPTVPSPFLYVLSVVDYPRVDGLCWRTIHLDSLRSLSLAEAPQSR